MSRMYRYQRGFLMPLAVFILVAMSFFAVTISRLTGQAGIATTQEAITVASFYAAESGAQLGSAVKGKSSLRSFGYRRQATVLAEFRKGELRIVRVYFRGQNWRG